MATKYLTVQKNVPKKKKKQRLTFTFTQVKFSRAFVQQHLVSWLCCINTDVGATSSLACVNPDAALAGDSHGETLVASEQFMGFCSPLVRKFHSIMGLSSLPDCRNYHPANQREVPYSFPVPQHGLIRPSSPVTGEIVGRSSLTFYFK